MSQYLNLNSDPIVFEPVSSVNSVFFDEVNNQIFTVRSGGVTGVVVKGPNQARTIRFQLDADASPISIKYSHNRDFLGVQRSATSIEIFEVVDGKPVESRFALSSKSFKSSISTFHWVSNCEVVLVTKEGIEFYQINQNRKEARLIKSYSLPVVWSQFLVSGSTMLCHVSTKSGTFYPFFFKDGKIFKMCAFSPDSTMVSKTGANLNEKDVSLINVYDELYVAVVNHPLSSHDASAFIDLYLLSREAPAEKKFTLLTKLCGRFAVSVVDNLIVIHHQASKSSMVFDLKLPGIKCGSSFQILPVVDPMPIQSQSIQVTGYSLSRPRNEMECQMYAHTWIVFPPNIIIDAAMGFLWLLEIKLEAVASLFNDLKLLIDFLLLRHGSKSIILKVLKRSLATKKASPSYCEVGLIFDRLNGIYKEFREKEHVVVKARQRYDLPGSFETQGFNFLCCSNVVIDQSDMYVHVLLVITNTEEASQDHVCSITLEYIRSLNDHNLEPQEYLFGIATKTFFLEKRFYALEQYANSGVIISTKHAMPLISLPDSSLESHNFAIDLFKKTSDNEDEIINTLLSQGEVLEALKFVKTVSMQHAVSARKFLETARDTGDDVIFYETFKYFQSRNFTLRGSTSFTKGEQCDDLTEYFRIKFGQV